MGERHDNAFKKGNGANGVVVIEPAKGTARLSPASTHYPHKHLHIDDHTIVHDVSQAGSSDIGGGGAAYPAKEVYCSGYAAGLQQEILCWESRRTGTLLTLCSLISA
uniref:Uncharacterized protein n=1 Tax=Oryza glumipatula TaxID=40148 RepID=A0A0E0BUV2_9ORYZ